MKIYEIRLTHEERKELKEFSAKGVRSTRLVNRAKIILALDRPNGRRIYTQDAIMKCIGVSRQTIQKVKRDFMEAENVSAFLQRKKRLTPPVPPKVTGELEARIIALACGEVPKGFARWTLRLLADKCVELHYSDTMSHMTIGRLLKKHNLNLT